MKEHYADAEYNLERFVRDMGYSKTLVNKKMQDLTGQPIGQFMKNYRLNVAQRMIQEGYEAGALLHQKVCKDTRPHLFQSFFSLVRPSEAP